MSLNSLMTLNPEKRSDDFVRIPESKKNNEQAGQYLNSGNSLLTVKVIPHLGHSLRLLEKYSSFSTLRVGRTARLLFFRFLLLLFFLFLLFPTQVSNYIFNPLLILSILSSLFLTVLSSRSASRACFFKIGMWV